MLVTLNHNIYFNKAASAAVILNLGLFLPYTEGLRFTAINTSNASSYSTEPLYGYEGDLNEKGQRHGIGKLTFYKEDKTSLSERISEGQFLYGAFHGSNNQQIFKTWKKNVLLGQSQRDRKSNIDDQLFKFLNHKPLLSRLNSFNNNYLDQSQSQTENKVLEKHILLKGNFVQSELDGPNGFVEKYIKSKSDFPYETYYGDVQKNSYHGFGTLIRTKTKEDMMLIREQVEKFKLLNLNLDSRDSDVNYNRLSENRLSFKSLILKFHETPLLLDSDRVTGNNKLLLTEKYYIDIFDEYRKLIFKQHFGSLDSTNVTKKYEIYIGEFYQSDWYGIGLYKKYDSDNQEYLIQNYCGYFVKNQRHGLGSDAVRLNPNNKIYQESEETRIWNRKQKTRRRYNLGIWKDDGFVRQPSSLDPPMIGEGITVARLRII